MKQSRKALKPQLDDMTDCHAFIQNFVSTGDNNRPLDKFICHCYEESDLPPKSLLRDVLTPGHDTLVMVGPEGDFSLDEVRQALDAGFRPVSLGQARLRTETAALVAIHLMNLSNDRNNHDKTSINIIQRTT